jgi:hypothetical protein
MAYYREHWPALIIVPSSIRLQVRGTIRIAYHMSIGLGLVVAGGVHSCFPCAVLPPLSFTIVDCYWVVPILS